MRSTAGKQPNVGKSVIWSKMCNPGANVKSVTSRNVKSSMRKRLRHLVLTQKGGTPFLWTVLKMLYPYLLP